MFFTGPISSEARDAWYRRADVYLSMSVHEGFCAPLIEALAHGVPVVARAAGAVPETLGGAGVLLDGEDLPLVSEALNELASSPPTRAALYDAAERRLAELRLNVLAPRIRASLEPLLGDARSTGVTLAVGLNALHLVPGETGGSELYARRLVGALAALEESPRIVVFAPNEAVASLAAEPWAERVEIVRVPVQARRRVRRVLAEQTLLRRAIAGSGVELLHNLFTTAPALPGVPQVTTILDVIYKRFPETHAGLLSYGMRLLVPLAARRSRRVLTLSQAAKDDIVRFLHVPADKVDVTYLGPALQEDETVSERRRPPPARARRSADRAHGLREEAAQEPRAALRGVQRRSHGA